MTNNEEIEGSWLVRPCEIYKEEYNDCTSIKARFHQYFIFGETIDCSQWKRDLDNCMKLKENNGMNAMKDLISSEKKRRLERLEAHYKNNTWKKRSEPPADWNKPLPEWMEKDFKDSYLDHKSQELNGIKPTSLSSERSLCILS